MHIFNCASVALHTERISEASACLHALALRGTGKRARDHRHLVPLSLCLGDLFASPIVLSDEVVIMSSNSPRGSEADKAIEAMMNEAGKELHRQHLLEAESIVARVTTNLGAVLAFPSV